MLRLATSHDRAGNKSGVNSPGARLLAYVAVVGLLMVTFELDRRTGSAPVQHLYYLPIIVAGVAAGWRGGPAAALASILLYHVANPRLLSFRYHDSDLIQIALFISVGLVTAKLTEDAHRFHLLAMTDDLTGLNNLRSFEARLTAMVRDLRATREPLSLLVLDVDRLKSLNDMYGHLTGAEAVRTVGHILAARLPPETVACRYGGDEFAVAIPRHGESQAREIAEDLCRAVYATAPVLAGRSFPETTLSISVGVACHPFGLGPDDASKDDDQAVDTALFRDADRALYVAKTGGRNGVSVWRSS